MAKRKHQPAVGRRKTRDSDARTEHWLYGTHPVLAALANRARTRRRLLATKEAASRLEDRLAGADPRPEIVERPALERVLPAGAVHQGLALQVAPLEPVDLDVLASRLDADAPAAVVVLDQVTDPQNVGAILRSAAGFGAAAVVATERHAPPITGALAKAAAGALERVPLVGVPNLKRALDTLKARGFWCVGLDGAAERSLAEIEAGPRVAVVLGAEGRGLRRLTREQCDHLARIPTTDAIDSLNVAAAAAVTLYEVLGRGLERGPGR